MKDLPKKDRLREYNQMYHYVEQSIRSYGINKASDDCNNYVCSIVHTISSIEYEPNSYLIDTLNCRLYYLKQAMSDNGIEVNE